MTNYIIQGQEPGKSFSFADLLNADEENEAIQIQQQTQEMCLISNKPLDKTKIKLECGHAFNYINLYNEVRMNQKGYDAVVNYYETDKVDNTSIKCPYCRKIFKCLLPMSIGIDGVKLQRGVNSPKTISMKIQCEFDNLKGEKCKNIAYITPNGSLCNIHYKKSIKMAQPKTENIKLNKIKKISKATTEITELPELPSELLLPPKEIVYTEEMVEFEKKHTVNLLKKLLKEKGCKVSGTKKELVTRVFKFEIHKDDFFQTFYIPG